MTKNLCGLLVVLGAALLLVPVGAAAGGDPWAAYRFLLGEWVGEGGGQPGQGSGGFTYALELQDKVMVRRNHADYPAAGGRPAFKHDDLMVIYLEPGGAKASYWDNEGHVIHYTLGASADGRTVTFLSDVVRGAPRFRLSHTRGKDDTISIKFEVAPPGKPDEFKPYIEASARRKG
jgi:hypothetical protein